MTATEALDHLRAQGITLTCAGKTLRIAPRSLVTPAVSDLIQRHKPDLLTLLRGESVESPAVERQAVAAGDESHGAPASPIQSPSAPACTHAATYRRPSGVAVCLDCAATLAPGAATWQPQTIIYCEPGHHVWFPRCEGDGDMLQCQKCPEVQAAPVTPALTTPLDHRPVQAAHQAALPLATGPQHGEMVPSKRRR